MTDQLPFVMTDEQEALYNKLTTLQKKCCINSISGLSNIDSYYKAGGKAKSQDAAESSCSQIFGHIKVKAFMEAMEQKRIAYSLSTRDELKSFLMKKGKLEYVFETIELLEDLKGNPEMEAIDVQRLSKALDTRVKLLAKFMPDEKSVEVKNAEGEEFKTSSAVTFTFTPVGADD